MEMNNLGMKIEQSFVDSGLKRVNFSIAREGACTLEEEEPRNFCHAKDHEECPPILDLCAIEEEEEALRLLDESFFVPTPKTTRRTQKNLAPIFIVKINNISGYKLDRPLIDLLDTGSANVLVC